MKTRTFNQALYWLFTALLAVLMVGSAVLGLATAWTAILENYPVRAFRSRAVSRWRRWATMARPAMKH